ncbi:MAG: hypothetical protein ACKOAY_09360, partial [Haliscomenobacter sp.]
YMDDMVLWHTDKEQLLEIGHRYREYFEEQMALTLKPFCLNRSVKGLPLFFVRPGSEPICRKRKQYRWWAYPSLKSVWQIP